jgi:putative hydrolase of HD superfamily
LAGDARRSEEAGLARDADKLEMLLQAREYRQQGNTTTEPFAQTALAALRTPSGRRLGRPRCGSTPPRGGRCTARGSP